MLNSITYGVSSSPFLAIRTIKQLIFDEGIPYPLASKVLESDIYIDDVVSGCNTFEAAKSTIVF